LDHLAASGGLWAAAQGLSLAKLGRLVVNDTSFFARIAQPGVSVTTNTLEKFTTFLAEPANWPRGEVPQEVVDLAHRVGISAELVGVSPGNIAQSSRG
jgi:hypothetical protein